MQRARLSDHLRQFLLLFKHLPAGAAGLQVCARLFFILPYQFTIEKELASCAKVKAVSHDLVPLSGSVRGGVITFQQHPQFRSCSTEAGHHCARRTTQNCSDLLIG